jgi:hypothetical protein
MPAELWEVPDGAGLRYRYVAGLSAGGSMTPLVCEPELEPGRRLVLLTTGDIITMRNEEIASLPQQEKLP